MALPRGILRRPGERRPERGLSIRFDPNAPITLQHHAEAPYGNGEGMAAVVPTPKLKRTPSLRLATLNIVDARNNRLEAALRCLSQMNIDIGFLTETKLSTNRHTKLSAGYRFVATTANGSKGGVGLAYRRSKGWDLESIKPFGPNVVRATLVAGHKRWYVIGAYIPPSEEDGQTLDFISEAAAVSNPNWPIILLGDLNVDLNDPAGNSMEGGRTPIRNGSSNRIVRACLTE